MNKGEYQDVNRPKRQISKDESRPIDSGRLPSKNIPRTTAISETINISPDDFNKISSDGFPEISLEEFPAVSPENAAESRRKDSDRLSPIPTTTAFPEAIKISPDDFNKMSPEDLNKMFPDGIPTTTAFPEAIKISPEDFNKMSPEDLNKMFPDGIHTNTAFPAVSNEMSPDGFPEISPEKTAEYFEGDDFAKVSYESGLNHYNYNMRLLMFKLYTFALLNFF